MKIRLRTWIIVLLLSSAPFRSFSAELIYTIQIGSHLSEQRARQQYLSVLEELEEQEKSYLRIEHLDDYYALRLGKFATPEKAKGLFAKINTLYPGALVLEVYISHNRLIEMYPAAPAAGHAAPPLEQEKHTAPPPAEKMEVSQPVSREDPGPAAVKPRGEPALTTTEKPDVPRPDTGKALIPAAATVQEDSTVIPAAKPGIEARVTVDKPAADKAAAVKPLPLTAESATPARAAIAGGKAPTTAESPSGLTSPGVLGIVAAIACLILLLLVRNRRTSAEPRALIAEAFDEQPVESPEIAATSDQAQKVPADSRRYEIAEADRHHSLPSMDGDTTERGSEDPAAERSDDLSHEQTVAEEPVTAETGEPSESEAEFPVIEEPREIDLPDAATYERIAAKPVDGDRENRLTRAMEAVTLGDKKR